jgi:hypothetical protein
MRVTCGGAVKRTRGARAGVADPEALQQLAGFSERQIRMGIRRDTIRLLRHGEGVKRSTYERIIKYLRENASVVTQKYL